MISLTSIIEELNFENGSNYKISVLKKYSNDDNLKRLLKMTYDHVCYTYGVKKIPEYSSPRVPKLNIEDALDILEEKFVTRKVTGNAAIELLQETLSSLSIIEADLLSKVIKRDLRINLGRTSINKVYKGLITKPLYMRCGIYTSKTKKDISMPAFLQLKADGTYREFTITNDTISCCSRSGETYDYPVISREMLKYSPPEGSYFGELTVRGIPDRAEANGLINSDNPPHDDIIFQMWDYVTPEEYQRAGLKNKKDPCKTPYEERFNKIKEIFSDASESSNVKPIMCKEVFSHEEAEQITSEWMKEGFEGAILKSKSGVFKDGTPKYQLKMKVAFEIDVRITGFIEGTPGTKREKTFGSVTYEIDGGLIKGSVSGFTDKQLEDFNSRREEIVAMIMVVEANDITQGRGNDYYALSHPRFIELRTDKDNTDTFDRAFQNLEMAKSFRNN